MPFFSINSFILSSSCRATLLMIDQSRTNPKTSQDAKLVESKKSWIKVPFTYVSAFVSIFIKVRLSCIFHLLSCFHFPPMFLILELRVYLFRKCSISLFPFLFFSKQDIPSLIWASGLHKMLTRCTRLEHYKKCKLYGIHMSWFTFKSQKYKIKSYVSIKWLAGIQHSGWASNTFHICSPSFLFAPS